MPLARVCRGVPDICAFVEVANDRALKDVVLKRIQGVAGMRSTETHVVIPD